MTTTKTAPRPTPDAPRQRPLRLKIASWLRSVHIYLSMFSLMIVLFFSVTGVTLNHPDWFFKSNPTPKETTGKVNPEWLANGQTDESKVDKLNIVESLRKEGGVRGALDEFRVDELECMVSFKAPGYAADSFIDRTTGSYRLSVMEEGAMAALNDLHKGRHSGSTWAWVIDASAAFLIVISLTGLGLIFYLKRIRTAALLTAFGGIVALYLFARFLVP